MSTTDPPAFDHQHPFAISGLDHIALRVANMSASVAWYQQVLGFEQRYADVWDRPIMLVAAQAGVALFDRIQQIFHQILRQRLGSVILQCV